MESPPGVDKRRGAGRKNLSTPLSPNATPAPTPGTPGPAPAPAPASWQREYHRKVSSFAPIFVAGVLGFMGLIFLISVWPLGLLLIAGAVGIPFLIRYLATSVDIVCGPGGFSYHSKSKRT